MRRRPRRELRMAPLVSVVIPCYNHARYLPTALASVHGQDWPSIESIVIDDGSTDDSEKTARACGATIVKRQPNRGLSQTPEMPGSLSRGVTS